MERKIKLKKKSKSKDEVLEEGEEKEKEDKKNYKWTLISDEEKYDNYLKLDDINFPMPTFVQEDRSELDPWEIFQLFFTEDLFQHFFDSTKYHVEKKNLKTQTRCYKTLIEKKTYNKLPIRKTEIKVYLGILLAMALNKTGSYVGIIFNKYRSLEKG